MHSPRSSSYIAYTRCSTDEQQRRGNSHEYQIDGIRRSGAVRSGALTEIAHFQDTVSGTRFDNRVEGLDQVYKLCERQRGKIDYLFIYRWDRLGRDVGECFECVKRFRKIGVEVNCPDEWIEYGDPSYPILLGVRFGAAQGESMRISDRTRDGQHAALVAGVHIGIPPVGYIKSDKPVTIANKPRKVCVVDEAKATLVRECFERVANGGQRSELYKEYRSRLGVSWSQFYRIFSNPFYAGKLYVRPHREQPAQYVEGLHHPIITNELYERVQVSINQVEPPRSKSWTLNGSKVEATQFYLKKVLRCDKTGRPMRASMVKGRCGKHYPYYHGFGKGSANIMAPKAHAIFLQALSGMRIMPENGMLIRRTLERKLAERGENLTKQIKAAETAKARTHERLERIRSDYADGNLTALELRDMKRGFEADMAKHEATLIRLEAQAQDRQQLLFQCLSLMEGIDTVFAAADEKRKNLIAQAVFPQGVILDAKLNKVQTPMINDVIFALCGESISCEWLEIKKGTGVIANPSMGQSQDQVQTPNFAHTELLKQLFAA